MMSEPCKGNQYFLYIMTEESYISMAAQQVREKGL